MIVEVWVHGVGEAPSNPPLTRSGCQVGVHGASIGVASIAVVAWACGGPPRPQDPASGLPQPSPGIRSQMSVGGLQADGGLRVLLAPDSTVDQVEIAVRFPVGLAADPPGKEGLAHLVEHLVFQARAGRDEPTLEQRLAAVSTSFNATTDLDATHYLATATVAEAGKVVEVLATVAAGVRCTQLDRDALERERAIVQSERRWRADEDGERERSAWHTVGYPVGHPYRRAPATATSLAAITWDDVCGFLAEHYRAERAFAVVTGAVDRANYRDITAGFDRVAAGPAPVEPAVAPAQVRREPLELTVSSGVDRLQLVWAAPARHDEDGLIALMVATRLRSELAVAHKAGRLGEATVGLVGGTRAPLFIVEVALDGASPAEVRAAVGAALARLWRDRDEEQAWFLRAVALQGLFANLARFHGRSSVWADYLQHDASLGLFSSDLERIGGFTIAELERVTARVFALERAGEVRVRAGAAASPAESTVMATPGPEPRTVAPPDSGLPEAPRDRHQVRSWILPGGLTVVLVPSGQVPLATARLVVPAGTRDDRVGGEAWLAATTLRAATAGVGRYGKSDAYIGSALMTLGVDVGPTTTTFTATALTPLQDHLVWGLAALVRDGITDEEALGRLRERWRDRSSAATWDELAAAIATANHGPSALGPPITAASLARLDPRAIDDWRAEHYARSGAILVMTGDFSWSLMERHLSAAFAEWGGGPASTALPGPTRSTWISYLRDVAQVDVNLRLPIARGDASGEAAARLAAAALAEEIAAVRSRLGAAYVLTAGFDDDPDELAVVISGAIDAERAGPAAAIIAAAVSSLRAKTLAPATLTRARARAIRELHLRLGAGDAVARDAIGWVQRGLAPEHGFEVAALLAALPAEQLAMTAAAAIGPHQIAVVGGRAPAVAAVQAAFGAQVDVTIVGDDPE